MADQGGVPSGGDTAKGAAKGKSGKPGEAANPDAVIGGPLMTVVVRNEFYRDGFRNLIKIAIAEAVIIVALIITFIAYIDTVRSQNHYFATTADGRIMTLLPNDVANMGDAELLSWVSQAASDIMTFGYHDYQRRLQNCIRYFTRRGWETFSDALLKSRVIESVQALQQVVSAEPRSAPILIQKTVFNNKYRWIVKLPLKVTYQSGTETRVDNPDVTLVIDRVASLENPKGVAIEQWISTQPDNRH
jgi:intracellular multiplication protein IcmL